MIMIKTDYEFIGFKRILCIQYNEIGIQQSIVNLVENEKLVV